MDKQKIVIYRVSLFQSIVADFVRVGFLSGGFWVNANYIHSRMFSVVIVLLFALKIIAWGTGKKTEFTDKQSAIDFINN